MGSRLRENPEKLFEVFMEIAKPVGDEASFIVQKYPRDYSDEEVLKPVPKFAFPCDTERYTTTVDHFTFVLTELDSTLKFGYCRHATGAQTCLCIVSYLPWFEVFYNLLNQLAELINRSGDSDVTGFIRAAYAQDVPAAGVPVTIVADQEMLNFTAPDPNKLPTIPGNRNLTEYYNAVDTTNMMNIFASMLHERRIVVTSKKLSRLTACVHASVSLLYPMFWQHLFIPILPAHLIDYLSAPMPYVIGLHSTLLGKFRESELGDAVIVNVDENTMRTEYDDVDDLPSEVCSYLKKYLKSERVRMSMQTNGDAIPKVFLMALVKLIGGYRDALKFKPGEPITFDPEAFVQSRSQSMQPFLENMLHLQIFQQFINERLDMLNCGQGFSDIFEAEALAHADKLNTQTRYKDWLSNMKKQGNKFQKGGKDIWAGIKEKAAPVMSSAVHSVKSQGKKAFTGFKNKLGKEDDSIKPSKSVKNSPISKTKLDRERPSTITIGQQLKSARPLRPSHDSSNPDKLIGQSPGDEKVSRYKMITIEEKSLDDMDAGLDYNRIESDFEVSDNSSGRNSPSSISTSSAMDSHDFMRAQPARSHSKTNSFGNVPFIDVGSEDETVPDFEQSTASGFRKSDHVPDRPPRRSDRLISTNRPSNAPPPPPPNLTLSNQAPPRPAPRNSLILRESQASHLQNAAPLIEFHSKELDDTLDPFTSKLSPTVPQIDRLRELNINTSPENSINRTPPVRPPPPVNQRRSSSSSEKHSSMPLESNLLDFDPLVDFSVGQSFPVSNQNPEPHDQSPELLQSWNVGHLTNVNQQPKPAVQDLGPMPTKGFVQRTVAEFSATSRSSYNAPGNFNALSSNDRKHPPVVSRRPVSMTPDRSNISSSPYSGERQTVTGSPFYNATHTVQNNTSVNNSKQDPFGDLAGLQLGPKPKWETFE